MGMNLLKKLGEYDGRTPEERAYAIINHVVDFFITAVIVVAMIIGGYSYYIYQRQLHNADIGYTGYTMEQLGAVGWITIDHTDIDYPIMQGKTNTEYLNKNPLGEMSLSGSIFLDSASKSDFSDPYSIIYGHHMAQGKMFGALDAYHDSGYLKKHATGILKTRKGKTYSLKIVSCISISGKNQTVFDVQQNISNKRKELIRLSPELAGNKKILALSTCQDTETDERTVVFATYE
ncbi:class B sortase [Sharpea azabuensis]|jgi:sortase B|uniref:class B sortase n=1 Tax=Sharpea azabuensis TaxID=322505 RepID=UPI00156A2AB7|nr:class B sortase [Sharpea azabuensis]